MRVVVQRVKESAVVSDGLLTGKTGPGLMLLVGFEQDDTSEDILYAVKKVLNLRIFDDDKGVMNLSLLSTGGDLLVVSQFTLHASTRKGNRPSYVKAAGGDDAKRMYYYFVDELTKSYGRTPQTGVFGADMQVSLVNDGPVTILIDTKENLKYRE
jgi:D-tyrosyl-tRNA(Tyr) deacylase